MAAAAEEGVARRRANDERVRALHAAGMTMAAIARTVGIARMTAYQYLREGPPQRMRQTVHGRRRVREPFESYLIKRCDEGRHTATVL